MAAAKISQLTAYTTPLAADLLPIVDNATTTTKNITYAQLTAPLLRIDGTNVMDNNVALQQKDSGGTARNIFKTSSANLLTVGNTTDTMRLAAGNTTTLGHLVPNIADDTVALLAAAQTFTNKTITAAVLSGSFTGTYTLAGTPTITAPTITNPILSGTMVGGTVRSDVSAPQGFLVNGKISISVASNNITVAVKTLSGNDPSSSDPVYIRIADTVRAITAATSVTKNAGTNWCSAGSAQMATNEIDWFVYLFYSAIDTKVGIGFARVPYFAVGTQTNGSTTAENALLYDGTVIANLSATDNLEVVGRFAATLSATASFNWSIPTYDSRTLVQRPIYETRWLSYTCTGPTNCTITAKYKIASGTCYIMVKGVFTNTTVWTTQPTIPIAPSASILPIPNTDYGAMGVGGYIDAGTANKTYGVVPHIGNDDVTTFRLDSQATSAQVSNTVPITWAVNDVWWARLDYPIVGSI